MGEILAGKVNPAGRLPMTFYRSTQDLSPFTDYNMKNRTYAYFKGRPLYPFGHGLSYTTFEYKNLKADAGPEGVRVSLEVTNTGERDGEEVVQVYYRPVGEPAEGLNQRLCAFDRVEIGAGETKNVSLHVSMKELRRWDPDTDRYVVRDGLYTFRVGASSADIRLSREVELAGAAL
jgi:beta-glucosidase